MTPSILSLILLVEGRGGAFVWHFTFFTVYLLFSTEGTTLKTWGNSRAFIGPKLWSMYERIDDKITHR